MKNWPLWKDRLESPNIEGGLRLKGEYKSVENILISYVTVVRNNEKTLRRTIESVQQQSYKNIEHIVIDGNSTDRTLNIIKEYEDVIDYFASEPDLGLYDALNKAIELTRGHLILVLNSDDWLSKDSALYAANNFLKNKPQFIAGTAKVLVNDGKDIIYWKPQHVTKTSYFTVANLNHNAVYASKEAYELSGPYDISYKIAADTKWVLKCYDKGIYFQYTEEVLINFSLGGVSSDIYWHVEECKRIIKERFPFLKGDEVVALNYSYYQWREGFKYPLIGFNSKDEINKLLVKYEDRIDFISAIDLNNDFFTDYIERVDNDKESVEHVVECNFKEFVKKILFRYPVVYNSIKKLYNSLRR